MPGEIKPMKGHQPAWNTQEMNHRLREQVSFPSSLSLTNPSWISWIPCPLQECGLVARSLAPADPAALESLPWAVGLANPQEPHGGLGYRL